MKALGLISLNSPPHSSLSPPVSVNLHRPKPPLLFTSSKAIQLIFRSFIICNTMADSAPRSSLLPGSESYENGGTTGTVIPKYAEIVIVRHGETEWNAVNRVQGHLDVDLNDLGREQAVVVADRLSREPKISAVYSSDLKRAYVTAEIIAKHCGVHEVTQDPDFRERNLGALQGLIYSELAKVNPEAHKAFVSSGDDQELPGGGESFNQLYKRSTSALQRIAKKHQGERVVVVAHGGTIRALHRRASPHRRPAGKILNTSVSVFHISDEDKWSIISWSDVSHLNHTGFLESGFGGDKNSG